MVLWQLQARRPNRVKCVQVKSQSKRSCSLLGPSSISLAFFRAYAAGSRTTTLLAVALARLAAAMVGDDEARHVAVVIAGFIHAWGGVGMG